MSRGLAARLRVLVPGYALAIAVAYLGHLAHVPLAWVLGALLASGGLALAGVDLDPPPFLRKLGQATVGASVGLHVSAAVAVQLLFLLPAMIGLGLVTVLFCSGLSVALRHMAGLDQRTAYYAFMPGGLAEMGTVAIEHGGDPAPVVVAQALRVALVVIVLPPFLVLAAQVEPARPHLTLDPPVALGLIVACLGAAWLMTRTPLNNPWMLGAAALSGTLTALGLFDAYMPDPLFFGAQLLLGFAIGSRFERDIVTRLPRLVLSYSLLLGLLLGATALLALGAGALLGQPFATMLLALAPGGMAEMATTAEFLGVGVALVTGFHVVRAFLVNGFATGYWSVLSRLGFFDAGDRLWARLTGR